MFEGLAMIAALAVMGIYFIKSTDLPKDMKERSAQLRANSPAVTAAPKRYSFPKEKEVTQDVVVAKQNEEAARAKIEAAKKLERQLLIELHNKKIDELTMLITTLEQQIKDNNEQNIIIQNQINAHLETLRILKETKIA
jgi:hypothetical protein